MRVTISTKTHCVDRQAAIERCLRLALGRLQGAIEEVRVRFVDVDGKTRCIITLRGRDCGVTVEGLYADGVEQGVRRVAARAMRSFALRLESARLYSAGS